ncbi:hypothetical protein EfmAA94_31930 (plasmid) [Enterococcus faecium]|nr:hypothetical protein EfmAA94_31930 [Enterococcus faecium]
MRKFFYIRVSSYDQSIERQLISAKELGIEKKKEYNYIVKAKVSKRFIFNPKLEIYSVVIE